MRRQLSITTCIYSNKPLWQVISYGSRQDVEQPLNSLTTMPMPTFIYRTSVKEKMKIILSAKRVFLLHCVFVLLTIFL